jgi:hypothetical protein
MKKNNSFRGSLLKVAAFAVMIAIASCGKVDNSVSEDASANSGAGKSSAKVLAYSNEVRASGSSYIWRTGGVDRGSTSSLATAILQRRLITALEPVVKRSMLYRAVLYRHRSIFNRALPCTAITLPLLRAILGMGFSEMVRAGSKCTILY